MSIPSAKLSNCDVRNSVGSTTIGMLQSFSLDGRYVVQRIRFLIRFGRAVFLPSAAERLLEFGGLPGIKAPLGRSERVGRLNL
jgi:hypothetical protein